MEKIHKYLNTVIIIKAFTDWAHTKFSRYKHQANYRSCFNKHFLHWGNLATTCILLLTHASIHWQIIMLSTGHTTYLLCIKQGKSFITLITKQLHVYRTKLKFDFAVLSGLNNPRSFQHVNVTSYGHAWLVGGRQRLMQLSRPATLNASGVLYYVELELLKLKYYKRGSGVISGSLDLQSITAICPPSAVSWSPLSFPNWGSQMLCVHLIWRLQPLVCAQSTCARPRITTYERGQHDESMDDNTQRCEQWISNTSVNIFSECPLHVLLVLYHYDTLTVTRRSVRWQLTLHA